MSAFFKRFWTNEQGTVTTDWIVLVASLILLSFIVISTISVGATDVSGEINTSLQSVEPGSATN